MSAEDLRARTAALERFAAWEADHPPRQSSAQALEGIGFLYELLPPEARARPVDPSGVMKLHRALALLPPRPK